MIAKTKLSGTSEMKKPVLIVQIIAILLLLLSCRRGPEQPGPASAVADVTSPHSVETLVPEIDSAVEFLALPQVITKADDNAIKTTAPETLAPGEYYTGGTPNFRQTYDLLILDRERSLKILEAADLTNITYFQSECLPIMLRWDNVSVLDMYRYSQDYDGCARRAYYYYLDDSTVVILNDALRTIDANRSYDKAWILVIPKEDEAGSDPRIPPMGTFVDRSDPDAALYEPYYDFIRGYFMKDPDLPQRAEALDPVYEGYMTDYAEWMKWRGEHPDHYEKWKKLSYPPKDLENTGTGAFRIDALPWCEAFRDGDEEPIPDSGSDPQDLPGVYYQIKQYGVPKEEMLEYVKWMRWSGAFSGLCINEEHVEALYSNDESAVRRFLAADNAVLFEGNVYTEESVLSWIPAYDVARMFSREEFAERFSFRLDADNTEDWFAKRIERLKGGWDEFERLREEDDGALSMDSAVRVLADFMEFYREVRYSPEILAGEPASSYDELCFSQNEYMRSLHFSNKRFPEIREEMYCIFTPEVCVRLRSAGDAYHTVFYSNQFSYFLQDGFPNQDLVSDLNKFYDGPVELFSSDYKLADHVRIDGSDDLSANLTLTAWNRSGKGESTYTVELSKKSGRWLISGGTILELVETDEAVKQWE